MGEQKNPPPQRSLLGWCILFGSVTLGLIGALVSAVSPTPSDLDAVSGAIYGLVLGAILGVLVDRPRNRQ